MSVWIYIRRSLRHFWRSHLAVVAGFMIGATVLTGALFVGDSVNYTLRKQALARIGEIQAVLGSGERFFREDLATAVEQQIPATVAASLQLRAISSAAGGGRRAGGVMVHGVDADFFRLGPAGSQVAAPERGQFYISEALAQQLDVAVGDDLLLRVEQPSALPRDMVLATTDDISSALRGSVERILTDAEFGRFGFTAAQVPPRNAFVDLAWLQETVGQEGRCNLLSVGASDLENEALRDAAEAVLRDAWSLADAELEFIELAGGAIEVRTPRVFLDTPLADAVDRLDVPTLSVLTYFVNALSKGERRTPYSMVTALAASGALDAAPSIDARALVPSDLAADEVVVNSWLAEDLQCAVGDTIELTYFVPGNDRRLVEETRSFRVRAVVELAGLAADPDWMPDFPGLADSENCRDWEPGIPIELDAIRDKDEDYWDEYHGAPKAFIALATGRELWANRFGSLTGLRFAASAEADVEAGLRSALTPASLGLFFRDIRTPALASATSATDFGGLFIGLSFFLIGSALLLTMLVFVLGIEQRSRELGTLLAVGLPQRLVRRLLMGEVLALAAVGSLLGTLTASSYTRAILDALSGVWSGAVASAAIEYHATPVTLAIGIGSSLAAAWFAAWFTLRGRLQQRVLDLLAFAEGVAAPLSRASSALARRSGPIALTLIVAAIGIAASAVGGNAAQTAGAFFGAASSALVGGLFGLRWLLERMARGTALATSVGGLGRRNAARRPARSLATASLLACGAFLVLSIGAHHKSVTPRDDRRDGTGGFALVGESTIGLFQDPASDEGREAFGFEPDDLEGIEIVGARVKPGDDASCLNLASPQLPRLLGIDPRELDARAAFAFKQLPDRQREHPWRVLGAPLEDGALPGIIDHASMMWTLKKSVGDTLEYTDERGEPLRVRIVATLADSILQGDILIGDAAFRAAFPSESGSRFFLVDAPREQIDEVNTLLTDAFFDLGAEFTPTTERLAAFNAVQNSYLAIFQVLGGLGVLLGSVGLGIVVVRNALERRRELAALGALGFGAGATRRYLLSEHLLLIALGLGVGSAAAAIALVPALGGGQASAASGQLAALFVAMVVNGCVWALVASMFVVRKSLLSGLRAT